MSIETIVKTVFALVRNSQDVNIELDDRGLGMAYAIPKGSAETVVADYGPWKDADIKQVFYQQSDLVFEPLADIQLILNWRYSEAHQYIVDATLEKRGNIAMGCKLSIKVRFKQPDIYDHELDAYVIPFTVEVDFSPPIGNTRFFRSSGFIRADGTGNFPAFS